MLITTLLSTLLLGSFSGPAPQQAPTPEDVVSMHVRFLDQYGNALTSIQAEEIQVFARGQEASVVRVIGPDKPFDVGMLLDVSPSGERNVDVIRKATQRFFRSFPDNAEEMILTFDSKVYVDCDWTTDRKKIDECIFEYGLHKPGSHSIIYEALVLALEQKYIERGPRQVMVLFTDGWENGSDDIDESDSMDAAKAAMAAVFTIQFDSRDHYRKLFGLDRNDPRDNPNNPSYDPNTLPGGIPPLGGSRSSGRRAERRYLEQRVQKGYAKARTYLSQLARAGGGEHFELRYDTDLSGVYDRILQQLTGVYTVQFVPAKIERDGRFYPVVIQTTRPDVVVRPFSKGYWSRPR